MRAIDQRPPGRNFLHVIDEHRAALGEIADHVAVMHDLVIDVDRRSKSPNRQVEALDRHIHAGTEAAWGRQDDFHRKV